ncbi:ATP-binding protein [Pedobacter fastidiosus]|uniref:histidine kinase n=1 Tax=Pedobacter fastidiosus TaxID=2765361 RepID=A0ABR7KY11_9SPHI|nr:ATP-binding protein [Pedobacter fastidiosus]MBC6112612.1 response regulator [Pedobacter fastidiosus]
MRLKSSNFLGLIKDVFLGVFAVLLFCCGSVCAQTLPVHLSSDSLKNKKSEFGLTNKNWKFNSGSNSNWKNPLFSDSLWKSVNPRFGDLNIIPNWKGTGWFRLWITVDSALTKNTLGLRINHDGASEIYIDGKFKGGFGKIGTSEKNMQRERAPFEVIPFQIEDTKPHLIAIHYSNYQPIFPDFSGFQIWAGDYKKMHVANEESKTLFNYMFLSVAAQLALGLLHLFLFLFYPKNKLNLYYFFFSVFFAATSWAVSIYNVTSNPVIQYASNPIFFLSCILGTTTAWILLYKTANAKIPKWKGITIGIITLLYCLKYSIFPLNNSQDGFSIIFLIIMADGIWKLFRAIKKRQSHVWIVGLGMVLIVLFYFFVGADVFKLWGNYPLRCFVMSLGILSFPFCYSIYLALDFATTNFNLSKRLIEVEELSTKAIAQEQDKLELITQQAEKLEVTVSERTAEVRRQADKLREMDAVKSRFFINLTHEFRTPLTLILGPVKQLLNSTQDKQLTNYGDTIQRNAERLLNLINQLLDLSKLEAGKMELSNSPTEVIGLLKRNFLSFESLASQKGIKLDFQSAFDQIEILIDIDKLERILYNLISNAIKFTGAGGLVLLEISQGKNNEVSSISINVTDTGIGIPDKKIPYIFDRFYQVDSSDTRANEGTGIGLAITKELVELMGGKLFLYSKENEGTDIQVQLPIQISKGATIQKVKILPEISHQTELSLPVVPANEEKDLPLVLVIEDNVELRNYISELISTKYRLITASNGQEGINQAIENIPDLVVTDLMMPIMDGYQVCNTLKQDAKTSHIPVIILTAKADTESRITGFETRADAYLSKPFDQRELLAVIENLITLRIQLREKFSIGHIWLTDTSDLPSMEQVFLNKVRKVVELHLDDEQFSVEKLGDEIGLSRTQLHRKLTGLLNQSPGDLIRLIRLQRAYELLKNRTGTVSEISYMVGYGNPKNFSTSFSKHFGFSPSEAVNH